MLNQIFRFPLLVCTFLFALFAEASSIDSLDQRVAVALGQGEATGFRDRLHAVQSLYKRLSPSGAEALFEGIIAPSQPQGLPLQEWAALYNDVFNAFNQMPDSLDHYPERLLSLIGEEGRPTILRDYALQHLLVYLEFRLKDGQSRKEILNKVEPLVSAAPETTLPSTYLLGIWQLAGEPGYPLKETIGKAALDIAADPEAFTPNRISAIQICGQLGYEPALPIAREISSDTTLRAGFRSAAIATIGDLGDASETVLLRKIKFSGASDARILYAADSALKKLQ